MKGKKLVALLAAGTMVFSPAGMALGTPLGEVFTSAVSAAEADEYLYYNEDTGAYETRDIPTTAVSVTANDTRWTEGWYVVDKDTTIGSEEDSIDGRVWVDGDVHLVLKDGCDLNIYGGIRVAEGDSLTIYAQSNEKDQVGSLTAISNNINNAGIGGNKNESAGKIVIDGGKIEVGSIIEGSDGAAIGGGSQGSGGNITFNGGFIVVNRDMGSFGGPGIDSSGAGIGGGAEGAGGNIQINNGQLTIQTERGAGIGSGSQSESRATNIEINGGEIDITSRGGSGIGGGTWSASGNITINAGHITIKGRFGIDSAGIGSGSNYYGGNYGTVPFSKDTITINDSNINISEMGVGIGGHNVDIFIHGGDITAIGGKGYAGIGGSDGSSPSSQEGIPSITITDGIIYAEGVNGGAGIGGNRGCDVANISITGGNITAKASSDNVDNGAGAGIGSSCSGKFETITITGGYVDATGGNGDSSIPPSSGIGAGVNGTAGKVFISGGTVIANGGNGNGYYEDGVAIGSDNDSGNFSTILPTYEISAFNVDIDSDTRQGNAVVFANGYGENTHRPISDISQQDSWGGIFFLNGEGVMLGKVVSPTNDFTIPNKYSFEVTKDQTLNLSSIKMIVNGLVYNSGSIVGDNLAENIEGEDRIIQPGDPLPPEKLDTEALDNLIAEFENRTDLDQYTDESVEAVKDMIAEYQSKTGLTQDEIDEYLSKIQAAIDALRYETDIPAPDDRYYQTYVPAGGIHWSISDEEGDHGTYYTDAKYTALDPVNPTDIDSIFRETVRSSGVVYLYDYYDNLPNTISAKDFTDAWADNAVAELMQDAEKKNNGTIEPVTHSSVYGIRRDVIDEWENFLDSLGIYKASTATLTTWAEETIENYAYTFYDLDDFPVTVDWSEGDPDIILSTASIDLLNFDQLVEDILEMVSDDAVNDAQTSELVYLMQQYNKYVGDGLLDPDDPDTPVDPGTSGSALVNSMIAYFQSVAASGDYTEASIHRVQALINSIPDTLTDEQARYYADLIYDAVMAMEPKGSSDPVYIEVPVSSGGSSTGSSSASSTQTGWVHNTNGSVYYKNGKVLTGWQTTDGDRYYFSKQGFMQTGWQVIDGSYYYFSANGVMLTGWQKYDTAWYYLDPDTGKMVADGLYEIDGKTYYFYDWGGMAYNFWYQTESGWYFFGGDGAMKKAGWIQWDGNYYYLTASGRMAVNTTTPDGYYVNANGVWNE